MPGVSTLPEVANLVAARGGGGGARPQDPTALAARALRAATGDDKETALRLYDYGMETYGPTFAATYNTLRDQRELATAAVTPSEPGVLRKVASAAMDTVKVGDDAGLPAEPDSTGYVMKPLSGLPRTEGGKGGIIGAGGLPRSPAAAPVPVLDLPPLPEPPAPVPVLDLPPLPAAAPSVAKITARPEPPEPAPFIPQGADAAVAQMLREAEQANTKYRADQTSAANVARAGLLKDATLDAKALIESGMTAEQAVAEALKQPKVAGTISADELRSSIGLPPVEAPPAAASAVPPAPPAPASTSVITPPGAPVPGGDATASSTGVITPGGAPAPAASRSLPVPDIVLPPREARAPTPSGKWGLQPDGSYIDIPPGGEVSDPESTETIVKATGRPARKYYDPRPDGSPSSVSAKDPTAAPSGARSAAPNRNVAAPPGSGGLATLVVPPPAPASAGGGTVVSNTTTTMPGGGAIVPATTPAAATADPAAAAPDKAGYADFMGEPNVWSFLTSAGLGALTSESPTALGAIGAGGTEGIKQLGTLRKEKRERLADQNLAAYRKETSNIAREQNANTVNIANQSNALGRDRLTADTKHNEQSIGVQTYAIDSQNKRSAEQIASSEREAELNRQSAGQNLNTQIQANLALKGMDITSQRDLQIERGKIEMQMQGFKQDLENQGKVVQREDMFNFLVNDPKGPKIDPKVAGTMVAGFGPQKPDAFKPLGEKEVSKAHAIVASSLFGEGVTEEQLLAAIPPAFQTGYLQAIGTAEDASTAAARGLAFFMSKGLDPRNEATFRGLFGDDYKLRMRKPPATTTPAATTSSATQRYDPATGKLVPAQ